MEHCVYNKSNEEKNLLLSPTLKFSLMRSLRTHEVAATSCVLNWKGYWLLPVW